MNRSGKVLLIATRVFTENSRLRSWWYLGTTLFLLVLSLFLAGLAPWWPLRLAGAILSGLIMARAFILYHDFMHGSILKGSLPAKLLLYAVGLLMLVPPRSWRESHNYHHANVAKLGKSGVGSYPLMTIAEWSKATPRQRFVYRLSRHPLTILSAYFTIFGLTITVSPLLKHPRKNWDSLVALVLHGGMMFGLWVIGGPWLVFFVVVLPFAIASALGAYLFYAQHTFPGIKMLQANEWTYYRAALESSSYLKMGRVMSWFLGNIGYHHVHHLNRLIPFYRLPEAMAAIPELQHPTVTSLHPHDILACLRLNLWDEHAARMVSYHEVDNSLMSIPPGEDIGREVHERVDQLLVFVKGKGRADLGGETHDINPGDMFAVPAGMEHDFINTGPEDMKLFTVYSPPEHPDGVVHATKADALAHPEE